VIEVLKDYYNLGSLDAKKPTDAQLNSLVDVSGDTMFNYGIDVSAKLHAMHGKSPTFFEFVTYPAEHTLAQFRSDHSFGPPKYDVLKAATHGTDMLLLFNMFPIAPMKAEEEEVSRKFVQLTLDFLANGKSTVYPNWKPLSQDGDWRKHSHIDLGKEFIVKPGLPYQERMNFWRGLNVFWNATLPGRGSNLSKQEL